MGIGRIVIGKPQRWPRRVASWLPRGGSAWYLLSGDTRYKLYHFPHRGYLAVGSGSRSSAGYEPYPVLDLSMTKMKRKVIAEGAAKGGPKSLAATECKTLAKFPNLLAHMAEVVYDDGAARKPGWMTVKTLGQSWQVTIKDPDAEASMSCLGSTLDEALALAEKLLTAENAPWERDVFLMAKKGRR